MKDAGDEFSSGTIAMDTLELIDPELRPLLALFPKRQLTGANLAEARLRTLPIPPSSSADVVVREVLLAGVGDAHDIPIRIYKPAVNGPLPCIFHMHGGGFVMGSAKEMAAVHTTTVSALQCAIVSVDYRLAPETAFPGNIDDCYAALAWTFANASIEEFDTTCIGVMGESAGGGLAASLALMARDRGEFPLAFQHLIYPMLDDRTCTLCDPHPIAGEFIWDAHNNQFGWQSLLGHPPGLPDVSPYAAAARAGNLERLPPAFISAGGLDLFVDENIDYAQRLNRSGVAVELHVYPGAFHGFTLAPDADVARAARRDSLDALRRFFRSRGHSSD